MPITYRTKETEASTNKPVLKVFCTNLYQKYMSNKITLYYVAAESFEDALDIVTKKLSAYVWVERTKDDFRRIDHWEAWLDHNREKEYKRYLKHIAQEKEIYKKLLFEIPNVVYIGSAGVFHTENHKI